MISSRKKNVYLIGAGLTKAACNSAPLGRELLKALEDFFDNCAFVSNRDWPSHLRKELAFGRKASNHFREIVNNLNESFYSSIFPQKNVNHMRTLRLPAQNDVEMILSLIDLHKELFRRSGLGWDGDIDRAFYDKTRYIEAFLNFFNWTVFKRLSPSTVTDENHIAKAFCENSLHTGDTVITFNYDLLLDQALHRSHLWFPIKRNHKKYTCGYWGTSIKFYDKSLNMFLDRFSGDSKIDFIKLHGSINWYHPSIRMRKARANSPDPRLELPDDRPILGRFFDLEDGTVVHPIFWTQKRPLLRNFDCGIVLFVPVVFEFDRSQIA